MPRSCSNDRVGSADTAAAVKMRPTACACPRASTASRRAGEFGRIASGAIELDYICPGQPARGVADQRAGDQHRPLGHVGRHDVESGGLRVECDGAAAAERVYERRVAPVLNREDVVEEREDARAQAALAAEEWRYGAQEIWC